MRYRIRIATKNEVGGTSRRTYTVSLAELVEMMRAALTDTDKLVSFEVNVLVGDTKEVKA